MEKKSKTLLYWACQFIGWGIYTGLLLFNAIHYNTDRSVLPKVIIAQFTIGICTMFVSHGIRYILKKKNWLELPVAAITLRILGLAASGALLSLAAIHLLMLVLLDWFNTVHPLDWSSIPIYSANLFFMLTFWSVIYVSFKSIESARKNKIEKLETESALKEAELIALKAQINPHFLFNSLNNIRALILEDQMKARDMVTNLSDILRYSIEFSKRERVTIAEEIEILKNYLDLESIQYEGRLSYQIDADEDTLNCIIPPMIIQTLAENAVKHGISQLKEGGKITIKISKSADLRIEVANTGQISDKQNGTGIGIKNATSRIQWLLSAAPSFTLAQQADTVVATLQFPAKYESDNS